MIELQPNIFMVEVPLKDSPLKYINCYVIKGKDRSLLIDTAFNLDETEQAIMGALSELNIAIEDTDIFITHSHSDHSGLAARLKRPENKVFISKVDGELINQIQDQDYWSWVASDNLLTGIPAEYALNPKDHIGYKSSTKNKTEFTYLKEGDKLSVGAYDLEVIDLRGHSPGQIGLYAKKENMLFCGDHILSRITPNISAWDLENNYLEYFLDNLKKVLDMNVGHLYTAHRELPEDINGRITFLIEHHYERLQQVREILKEKDSQTPFEVSSKMEWAIKKGFMEFPAMQKWFACSEGLAHLQYLFLKGELERKTINGTLHYDLK